MASKNKNELESLINITILISSIILASIIGTTLVKTGSILPLFSDGYMMQLTIALVAMICGIIILFCSYWIYKIWKMPNLTRSQKWALMNGQDLPPAKVQIKSKYDTYEALFDEAEGNQKS